ncbi:MAG TPA: hypothetical protein VGA99_04495 [bacterium]
MKRISLLLFLLFTACDAILGPANLDEPFFLKFGASTVIEADNLRISFQEIREDSRCPSDVVCVWAGRARIGLLLQAPTDSAQIELQLPGFATQQDTLAHQPVDALGYHITLLQLDPYPDTERPSRDSDYRALLKVSRLFR